MRKIFLLIGVFCSIMCMGIFAHEIPQTIRVGINASSPLSSVDVSSDGGLYTYSSFASNDEEGPYMIGKEATITLGENGTLVCNGIDTNETQLDLYKSSDYIKCRGKLYRGDIRFIVRNGGIIIINLLQMDDYLYGVVGREMSESFPIEALKAQAVAARNYTLISMGRHSDEGYDLCNGVHCQAYGAVEREGEKIRQAVDETSGKVLLYKGDIVQCYYYSSNGGYTENSENVWYATLGYLKGKEDIYEDGSRIPDYEWKVSFSAQEMKNTLASRGIDIGEIKDIKIKKLSDNFHAIEVEIIGTEGKKSYYKDNIRAAFPASLKSTLFTIEKEGGESKVKVMTGNGLKNIASPGGKVLSANGMVQLKKSGGEIKFSINGKGSGHGVGMSQYGAMFMAEEGYSYEDILEFYFTDTEIKDL